MTDQGEWKGGGRAPFDHTYHQFEIVFDDLDFILEPGVSLDDRWFFAPEGHVTDPRENYSMWATSGDGVLNGSFGWWKKEPQSGPGWRPTWGDDRPKTDYAMRLEGQVIPAPGALVVFAGAMTFPRRRRGVIACDCSSR